MYRNILDTRCSQLFSQAYNVFFASNHHEVVVSRYDERDECVCSDVKLIQTDRSTCICYEKVRSVAMNVKMFHGLPVNNVKLSTVDESC